MDDVYASGLRRAEHPAGAEPADGRIRKDHKIEDRPLPEATPEEAAPKRAPSSTSNGVIVKGETGMLVRFAQCCKPLPGDKIVGYITRGRGVSVHRADCVRT